MYTVDYKLKYVGRCLDNFNQRINHGYGKIYPKNCFIDGRATNCRLNALITRNKNSILLWVCIMERDEEIKKIEKELIRKYYHELEWNIVRT